MKHDRSWKAKTLRSLIKQYAFCAKKYEKGSILNLYYHGRCDSIVFAYKLFCTNKYNDN